MKQGDAVPTCYRIYRILLARFVLYCRDVARRRGYTLRALARRLIDFGEHQEGAWGIPVLLRMECADVEIRDGNLEMYCGPIYAARFQFRQLVDKTAPAGYRRKKSKKFVVISLNWVATYGRPSIGILWPFHTNNPFFCGTWEVAVDPESSPLHELPDGSLWFMWPNGGYAVLRPRTRRSLRFTGDLETPRVYTYF